MVVLSFLRGLAFGEIAFAFVFQNQTEKRIHK